MTSTSTSNFSAAKVDFYIRKKTLELGERTYLWRKFVNKERIEAGAGASWKAVRYLRLDVPLAGLTEGAAPTETDLAVETITCTATQYGLTVKITDILMLTIASQPLQKAIEKKADVMAALDDKLICETALNGVNVIYGGASTTRAGMTSTGGDVLNTTQLRKARAALRATDGVKGRAPSNAGKNYVGFLHEKQIFDIQNDTDWKNMAYRLDRKDLEEGGVTVWAGIEWHSSDFLPEFTNLFGGNAGGAALDIANNTAVTLTKGMNGFKSLGAAGGTLTASKFYPVVVTRRHKKRGLEEGISSTFSIPTGAGETQVTLTMPSDTAYVYTVYMGANQASGANARAVSRANIYRAPNAINLAGAATVVITAEPANTNPVPPSEPPLDVASIGASSGRANVYPAFIFGGDALAVVDLQDMESYLVKGPDSGNPLNQFVIVGSKFMEGVCILQDSFLQRVESQSGYAI